MSPQTLLGAAVDLAVSAVPVQQAGERLGRIATARRVELDLARIALLRDGLPRRRAVAADHRWSVRNRSLSILEVALAGPWVKAQPAEPGGYSWQQIGLDDWALDPLPEAEFGDVATGEPT